MTEVRTRRRGVVGAVLAAVGVIGAVVSALAPIDTSPARAAGEWSVDVTSLDFGTVPVGSTAGPLTVTVTRVGPGPMVFSGAGGAPADPAFDTSQNCQGALLNPGESCQFTYTFSPSAPGSYLANSMFSVENSSGDPDIFTIELRGNAQAVCDPDPDCVEVSITKQAVDDGDADGSGSDDLAVTSPATWDWVIKVRNYDSIETAELRVVDTLPAGATVTSTIASAPASCTLVILTYTCDVDVPPQTTWELTITVTASATATYFNQAVVSPRPGSSQVFPNAGSRGHDARWEVIDSTANWPCVGCEASPRITKSVVSTGPFSAGDPIEFELGISGDLVNLMPWLEVTDELDPGFVFDSFTLNPGGACSHDGSPSGGRITCTFTAVPGHLADPGDFATWLSGKFTTAVRFTVRTTGPGQCPNLAEVWLGFWRDVPNLGLTPVVEQRDSDAVKVDVAGGDGRGCRGGGGDPLPDDIAVSKGLDVRDQSPGELRWAVTVANVGTTPVYQVTLTDELPETLEFVQVEPPHDVLCTFSDLLNPAPGGGKVSCVLPDHVDPDDQMTWLQPGETITVVIVTRFSGNAASDVRDCRNLANATLGSPKGDLEDSNEWDNWSAVPFELPEAGCERNDGNDPWDAAVAKTATLADGEVVFDLTVTNVGGKGIPYIELIDDLPDTVQFGSVDAPYDKHCSFSPGAGPGGGTLRCDLPPGSSPTGYLAMMEPGESITVRVRTKALDTGSSCVNRARIDTYAVSISAGKEDPLVLVPDDDQTNDVASVSFTTETGPCSSDTDGDPGDDPDGDPGDDPDGDPGDDPVDDGAPDLELDKQVEATSVITAEPFTYRLVYLNVGSRDAYDVTVADQVPAGLEILSVSEGCEVVSQLVTCVDPVVPPGVERAFLVTVRATFEGVFVNEARITDRDGDPEVDDDPDGGRRTDRVEVVVRSSVTPGTTPDSTPSGDPTPTGPLGSTGGGLPSTGGSLRLALVAAWLVVAGVGLGLAGGSVGPLSAAVGRRRDEEVQ